MKRLSSLIVGLFLVLISFNSDAQSKTGADFFTGKWNIVLKDVPGGDAKMVFVLEKKNDTLTGVVLDTAGTEISKIAKIEQKENEINVYFTTQGYDLNLLLTKKDDDHLVGKLMDMFEAEGVRAKELKK